MPPTNDRRRRAPRARRALIQLLAGLVLLVALELLLRLFGLAPPADAGDPYVGFSSSSRLFVPDASGARLETAPGRRNHFNLQSFPSTKPADTLRIFCLGGSSTYGRPYTDSSSFAGWLRELLPQAAPGQAYEVINAGGVSYASYRVAVIMQELLNYEPDLFVVYTGHNEFLEARTYGALQGSPSLLLGLGDLASRSALFHGLQRLLGTAAPGRAEQAPEGGSASGPGGASAGASAGAADGNAADRRPLLPAEVSALLDASVGPDAYQRDDAGRAQVLEHLRSSLTRMAAMAADAGAALVFVSPASQLKDCRPFKSAHDAALPAAEVARRDALLATLSPDEPAALPALRELAAAAPRHALTQDLLGEALLRAGDVPGARAALVTARDEDIVPLRAASDVLQVLTDVARAHDVPLLDWVARMDELARAQTGAPIPGAELFFDHVHMTPEATGELALELLALFERQGWIERSPGFDQAAIDAASRRVLASLDSEAHVRALTRVAQVLEWAGKHDEARALNERAVARSGGRDAMSLWAQGNHRRAAGDLTGAEASYRAALALDADYMEAHFNLGELLLSQGLFEDAAAHLKRALELDPGHAPSHFAYGVVLDRRGEVTAARNAWRRAIKLQPDLADAHNQLGVSHLRAGDVQAAEQALRRGLAAAPGSARTHHNLGVLLAESGRVAQALGEFQAAVTLDPQRASSRHKLGMAQMILGQLQLGLAELERAAALDPDDARIARDLSQARIRAGFQGGPAGGAGGGR